MVVSIVYWTANMGKGKKEKRNANEDLLGKGGTVRSVKSGLVVGEHHLERSGWVGKQAR